MYFNKNESLIVYALLGFYLCLSEIYSIDRSTNNRKYLCNSNFEMLSNFGIHFLREQF